jgi:transcriptional regulator with XRE-family HTH domain
MKVNQHNASSFAQLLGVQRSSLSHILNGRNNPSVDFIAKLLKNFPNVDANWLITGVEPTKREAVSSPDRKISQARISQPESAEMVGKKRIDKIVVFYTDKSFEEYEPSQA